MLYQFYLFLPLIIFRLYKKRYNEEYIISTCGIRGNCYYYYIVIIIIVILLLLEYIKNKLRIYIKNILYINIWK